MTNKELGIMMTMRDLATKKLMQSQSRIKKFTSASKANFVSLAAQVYLVEKAFRFLSAAVTKTVVPLVQTASKVEDLKVRLNVLFKSAKIGNQVFEDMAELAGKVPKTYDEIMESATQLAGVVEGGADEINKLMPIIVDIASGTGLTVQEATSNMIKMYSSGAAAAEMFRDRGISAALGFQAGVSYTNKETMDILYQQWDEGFGKYVGASDQLSRAFTGMTSMMQDAWFQFKQDIGGEMFEAIKDDMKDVLLIIQHSKREGGEYSVVVEKVRDVFNDMYSSAKKGLPFIIVSSGQVLDIMNELAWALKGAQAAWVGMIAGIMEATLQLENIPGIGSMIVDKEALEAAIEVALEDLEIFNQEIKDLREDADIDYSQRLETSLAEFNRMLEEQRKAYKKHVAGLERMGMIKTKSKIKGDNAETASEKTKFQNTMGIAAAGLALTRELADENKSMAIASAIISTAMGVARALAEYKYPLSLLVGGLVAAAGAIQIAKISSTKLAEGGIVPATPGGRLALIGEGGQDEAVIPLDRAKNRIEGLGGGGNMNFYGDFNIYVPTQRNDLSAEEIGAIVAEEIQEKLTRGRSFV